MICGVAPTHKPMLAQQVAGKLPFGVYIEWKGEQRLLQTGKPDLLKSEKEQWRQTDRATGAAGGASSHRQEFIPGPAPGPSHEAHDPSVHHRHSLGSLLTIGMCRPLKFGISDALDGVR